ncbi:unnamed protein product [Pleuronectes platessa]|uniref:Uncharacterized protein n=1 Tax=Pleuronectes platessa TaxID=8262 RepID=A0A9N7YVC1_PLEPL|nr:unnamed protein product [Pleuronectes platessa]
MNINSRQTNARCTPNLGKWVKSFEVNANLYNPGHQVSFCSSLTPLRHFAESEQASEGPQWIQSVVMLCRMPGAKQSKLDPLWLHNVLFPALGTRSPLAQCQAHAGVLLNTSSEESKVTYWSCQPFGQREGVKSSSTLGYGQKATDIGLEGLWFDSSQ